MGSVQGAVEDSDIGILHCGFQAGGNKFGRCGEDNAAPFVNRPFNCLLGFITGRDIVYTDGFHLVFKYFFHMAPAQLMGVGPAGGSCVFGMDKCDLHLFRRRRKQDIDKLFLWGGAYGIHDQFDGLLLFQQSKFVPDLCDIFSDFRGRVIS